MQKYIGKGVYGAIAIGRIAVFKREDLSVEKVCCEDTDAEIKRFENAKNIAITATAIASNMLSNVITKFLFILIMFFELITLFNCF